MVFSQEAERCRLAGHYFGKASKDARQAAWADAAGATAVEDEASVVMAAAVVAIAEAVIAGAAVVESAERQTCCAT